MADNQNPDTTPTPTDLPASTVATVPSGAGKEFGQSGTLIYSGIITNEEYNRMLIGRRGIRRYEEMRKSDSGVQQMLKACKLPILSVEWRIDPASDAVADKYTADFIKRELFDRNINWHSTCSEALTMLDFGWSLFEKVFELTEFEGKTRIGLKKLGSRKQLSIDKWETIDKKEGVTQQTKNNIVSIPQAKLVLFTNEKEGENYQGTSLLRYAYKDYDIRNKLIIANAVSLEKLGGGVPVLKAPAQADKKDMEKARAALRAMRINQEAYIELPMGWEIEMLDMKSNSVKDMLPTIEYHETMMKKGVLASFLDLGTKSSGGGGGSRALSEDHSNMFEKSLEAVAQVIASTINEQLIQQLCDLNFSSMPNGYPKLAFGNIGDEDLQVMGEYLNRLAGVDLITPDADLEDHLRVLARMPKLPKKIRDNYEDRQLNKNSLERTTLAPEDTTRQSNQPTDPTLPKPNDPNSKVLPSDPKNKPAPKPVKADVLADARANKQKLIDVILG